MAQELSYEELHKQYEKLNQEYSELYRENRELKLGHNIDPKTGNTPVEGSEELQAENDEQRIKIAELESRLAGSQGEIDTLKNSLADLETQLSYFELDDKYHTDLVALLNDSRSLAKRKVKEFYEAKGYSNDQLKYNDDYKRQIANINKNTNIPVILDTVETYQNLIEIAR